MPRLGKSGGTVVSKTSAFESFIDFGMFNMDISRRLGILVFCGVPAIVGGGIIVAIFGSLTPMWIYEALLLITAGALVSR